MKLSLVNVGNYANIPIYVIQVSKKFHPFATS